VLDVIYKFWQNISIINCEMGGDRHEMQEWIVEIERKEAGSVG
jgi:hypothetical protein